MDEFAISEVMRRNAQEAADLAWLRIQTHLDFSESRVEQLEMILAEIYGGFPKGLLLGLLSQSTSLGEVWHQSEIWGAYLGEVIGRRWGGGWALDQTMYAGAQPKLVVLGRDLFLVADAHNRLTNGRGPMWASITRL